MTFDEIKACDKPYLTANDVYQLLQLDPQTIRNQARFGNKPLPFPVEVYGSRTRIPRLGFVRYFEEVTGA